MIAPAVCAANIATPTASSTCLRRLSGSCGPSSKCIRQPRRRAARSARAAIAPAASPAAASPVGSPRNSAWTPIRPSACVACGPNADAWKASPRDDVQHRVQRLRAAPRRHADERRQREASPARPRAEQRVRRRQHPEPDAEEERHPQRAKVEEFGADPRQHRHHGRPPDQRRTGAQRAVFDGRRCRAGDGCHNAPSIRHPRGGGNAARMVPTRGFEGCRVAVGNALSDEAAAMRRAWEPVAGSRFPGLSRGRSRRPGSAPSESASNRCSGRDDVVAAELALRRPST